MISVEHHYGVGLVPTSTPKWRMGKCHQFGARRVVASANNIASFRAAKGWSRPELARQMATSAQQIERLEKGQRKLTQEWIDRAAEAFGVAPEAIITELAVLSDGEFVEAPDRTPTRSASRGDATVGIIALDLSLSMGPGTLIEEFVEAEPVKMDLGLLRSITRTAPDRLRFVRGIGDSMEPTLRQADQVLIDISDRALSRINGIYWVDHLGTHGIKRLRAAGKEQIMIMSDNPIVGDYVAEAEDVRIEGRAIWFGREL